ncbi:MAG: hypothetical protein RIQ89_556 [Bacteroidota bacterium]
MLSLLNQNYPLAYALFFLVSVGFSLLINTLFLKFVRTLGIRNNDNETVIRWGSKSKPAVGGFSFYISFLLSIIAYSILFDSRQVFLNPQLIGILLATLLGFLLGLTDDAYNTKPLLKFTTQIACGFILLITGTKINISSLEFINYSLTMIWIVGMMNSLNMLDNMDAITSLVCGAIICAVLTVISIHNEEASVFYMINIGVLAAIIGFLKYNWHPSKMYMGDTGSQFLGVFMAAMSINFLWNADAPSGDIISVKNFIIPVLAFIMPLSDTATVVINRISKGSSPFIGGKDHTTHALAHTGMNDRKVAIVFLLVSLFSVVLIFIIEKMIAIWSHLYSVIFIAYIILVFSILFKLTRKVMNN